MSPKSVFWVIKQSQEAYLLLVEALIAERKRSTNKKHDIGKALPVVGGNLTRTLSKTGSASSLSCFLLAATLKLGAAITV